jgi:hypothetical protein
MGSGRYRRKQSSIVLARVCRRDVGCLNTIAVSNNGWTETARNVEIQEGDPNELRKQYVIRNYNTSRYLHQLEYHPDRYARRSATTLTGVGADSHSRRSNEPQFNRKDQQHCMIQRNNHKSESTPTTQMAFLINPRAVFRW